MIAVLILSLMLLGVLWGFSHILQKIEELVDVKTRRD